MKIKNFIREYQPKRDADLRLVKNNKLRILRNKALNVVRIFSSANNFRDIRFIKAQSLIKDIDAEVERRPNFKW